MFEIKILVFMLCTIKQQAFFDSPGTNNELMLLDVFINQEAFFSLTGNLVDQVTSKI